MNQNKKLLNAAKRVSQWHTQHPGSDPVLI